MHFFHRQPRPVFGGLGCCSRASKDEAGDVYAGLNLGYRWEDDGARSRGGFDRKRRKVFEEPKAGGL